MNTKPGTPNTKPLLSGRPGSNRPPIAWKAIALPNELLPLVLKFTSLLVSGGSQVKTNLQTCEQVNLSTFQRTWAGEDSNL